MNVNSRKGDAKKIGTLVDLKDVSAREAIRLRGGGAGQVNQLDIDYVDLTVGELANLAAQGEQAAETAIKIVKQAKKKKGRYGNK
ncbi:MAG: hypothetical protein AAF702_21245 [Chloroflexota bacterium]